MSGALVEAYLAQEATSCGAKDAASIFLGGWDQMGRSLPWKSIENLELMDFG